jgi:hypothetical protein
VSEGRHIAGQDHARALPHNPARQQPAGEDRAQRQHSGDLPEEYAFPGSVQLAKLRDDIEEIKTKQIVYAISDLAEMKDRSPR